MQSVECVSLIEGPSHIYTKMAISEDKQKPVPQGNMPVLTLKIGELYIISHIVAMVIQFTVHLIKCYLNYNLMLCVFYK